MNSGRDWNEGNSASSVSATKVVMSQQVAGKNFNYSDHNGLAVEISLSELDGSGSIPTRDAKKDSTTKKDSFSKKGSMLKKESAAGSYKPKKLSVERIVEDRDLLVEVLPMIEEERGNVKKAYFRSVLTYLYFISSTDLFGMMDKLLIFLLSKPGFFFEHQFGT